MTHQVTTFPEPPIVLRIEKEIDFDGVGMGVLSDGTPYLTLRGLARFCGVEHALISRIAQGWNSPEPRPREVKIKKYLTDQNILLSEAYIKVMHDGVPHYAFPDVVCMAILEYYAFDPNSPSRDHAVEKFRLLARRSFKDFIYTQLGYRAEARVPIQWRQFLDRVALVHDRVPNGYFCVFKEIAGIIVTLIRHGAQIDHRFVPDISVGNGWAKHWKAQLFDAHFGERRTYDHAYPEYFPQASSNPQAVFCYPDTALAEFRRWFRETYLLEKFPSYIRSKVRDGGLPAAFSDVAWRAFGLESDQPLLSVPPAANTRTSPNETGATIANSNSAMTCRSLSTRR